VDLLTPARKWAIAEQERAPSGSSVACEGQRQRMPLPQHLTMFLSTVGPLAGLIAAIFLLWHRGPASVGWPEVTAMLVMYAIAGYGTTIGFHRHLTHKAFETYRPIRLTLAVFGSIAGEGAVIRWAATHRRHHQVSDRQGDPHSPHGHGDGVLDLLRRMWHAHMGWLFHRDPPDTGDSVIDLTSDPALLLIDRLYLFWVILGLVAPGVLVGLWKGSWYGFISGAVWGGLVRICLMQHVTWSINSVCHLWGTRPFQTTDHSVNNPICAIFALGEGWHNNHHAFPNSARQGLRWWEFDSSWLIIQTMGLLGLAWNIRTPAPSAMQQCKAGAAA
jgi:stearoyl-CoA desaturase (delta-9 desaturase)